MGNSCSFTFDSDDIKVLEYTDPTDKNNRVYYITTSSDINVRIGMIHADFNPNIPMYGNIGYIIASKFQGHNYAIKALNLITERIYSEGMKKAVICVKDYNIASKKVASKYGCKLSDKFFDGKDTIIKYEIDLKDKLEIASKKRIRKK